MSEGPSEPGIGRRMVRGAAWMFALRFAVRMLGVLSTVILARLLAPEDFGLIALATLISATLELMTSLNFQAWLVRHAAPEREHYDTVWTLSVIRGLLTALALAALAGPLAGFFSEPRLETLMVVIAAGAFLGGLENVGIVDFQRDLEFDRDFRLLLTTRVLSFVVTVGLAVWLRSYWALAAGLLTTRIVRLVLSYAMHPFRPRLGLSRFAEGFDFTKWLLLGNVMLMVYKRADTFILGRLVSSQVLGLYTVAHEIANLAATELLAPLSRVLFPGYARMIDDLAQVRQAFLASFALILAIGVPCALGLGLVAAPLVEVALGDQWLDAIPLMQILALYALATVARANVGPLLLALGHARLLTVLTVAGCAVLIPAFYLAVVQAGVAGGAVAASVNHLVVSLVTLGCAMRRLEVTWTTVGRLAWRVASAAALMALAVRGVIAAAGDAGVHPAIVLPLAVAAGAAAYGATLVVLWIASGRPEGAERSILEFVRARRAR